MSSLIDGEVARGVFREGEYVYVFHDTGHTFGVVDHVIGVRDPSLVLAGGINFRAMGMKVGDDFIFDTISRVEGPIRLRSINEVYQAQDPREIINDIRDRGYEDQARVLESARNARLGLSDFPN